MAELILPSEVATEVVKQRGKVRGNPSPIFEATAAYWSTLVGVHVSAKDVPLMMILHKIAREQYGHDIDNLVDMAGFANTYEMMDWSDEDQPSRWEA